jgi:CTP-dependent riboflavin kinase
LRTLEVVGPSDAPRLAAEWHVRSTVTKLGATLAWMEKRGLIERWIKVRGRHLWAITEKGRRVVYGDEMRMDEVRR